MVLRTQRSLAWPGPRARAAEHCAKRPLKGHAGVELRRPALRPWIGTRARGRGRRGRSHASRHSTDDSEALLTTSLPGRRLITPLTSALSLAVAVAVLALALQATAQARRAACRPLPGAHHRHGARACARSGHRSRAHARRRANGHHSRHAVGRRGRANLPATSSRTAAVCANGSEPILAGSGFFSCNDGSEPACPGGASPAPSGDGSALVCDVASADSASSAAICPNGAVATGDGSFRCEDGSEPTCEDGTIPVLSGDGSTLVCSAAARAR